MSGYATKGVGDGREMVGVGDYISEMGVGIEVA